MTSQLEEEGVICEIQVRDEGSDPEASAADGILEPGDGPLSPSDRSPAEKPTLLLESRGLEEQQHGEWLWSHGLHIEHLPLEEQKMRDFVTDKGKIRLWP